MWGILAHFHRHEEAETVVHQMWIRHRIEELIPDTECGGYHVRIQRGAIETGYYIPPSVTPHIGDEVSLLNADGFILRMLVNGVEVPLPWIAADRSA